MNEQGSSASALRRLALVASILVIAAIVISPAWAKPGNGNGPPPHANGNPGGPPAPPPHANNGGNPSNNGVRNHGANGRRVRAHGNPTHNSSPGRSTGRSGGAAGTRAHGSPSRGGSGGIVKQPRSRGNGKGNGGERENRGAAHQKTTICHATHSETNPFVEITISDRALDAHRAHQDGEDIVPAPDGGCPGAAGAATTPVAKAVEFVASVLGTPPAPAAPSSENAAAPGQEVAGATESGSGAQVLGAEAQGGTEPAAAETAGAAHGEEDEESSLPFTGLELLIVAAIGVALLLAGMAGRRAFTARA